MCPTAPKKVLKEGKRGSEMALACPYTFWMQCCPSSPSKSSEALQVAQGLAKSSISGLECLYMILPPPGGQ